MWANYCAAILFKLQSVYLGFSHESDYKVLDMRLLGVT